MSPTRPARWGAQSLLSPELKPAFVARIDKEYEIAREQHARKQPRSKPVSLAHARANRHQLDWVGYEPPKPREPGVQTFEDVPVSVLRPYIDWTPFFLSWELAGKFPASWKMRWWGGGHAPLRRCQRHAGSAGARSERALRWHHRPVPRQRRGRQHRALHRRVAPRGTQGVASSAPAERSRASPTTVWQTMWRRRRAASPTGSAPSR